MTCLQYLMMFTIRAGCQECKTLFSRRKDHSKNYANNHDQPIYQLVVMI
jgi:hypothetical protein